MYQIVEWKEGALFHLNFLCIMLEDYRNLYNENSFLV